jgi:tetratricopeptide (TPR) repeat protein
LGGHGDGAPIAERAALAAILADSEDPWAHYALGSVYLFTRRFDDSLAEFELALRLNPNFSLAQGYYGLALSYCGRWEEGNIAACRALRLSPRGPFSAIYYGIAVSDRNRTDKQEEVGQIGRGLDPGRGYVVVETVSREQHSGGQNAHKHDDGTQTRRMFKLRLFTDGRKGRVQGYGDVGHGCLVLTGGGYQIACA